MSEEAEESFDEIEEDFEAEVGEDIEEDIDLGDLDEDEDFSSDDDEGPSSPRRSSSNSKDDAGLLQSYEQAVKANPKRATKHQKRARIIEGVLDKATLDTEAGIAKAWATLQKQAGDAQKRDYSMKDEYTENDVVVHPKFGQGYVVEILTSTKVAVLFEDGIKKLAHNRA